MITSLRGTLASKTPTEAVLLVNGIGYSVSIPLSTFEVLGEVNSTLSLHTYLHVREDALQLYGFATEAERDAFRLLISVSGIGPKMAQGILSGISVADLRSRIAEGNTAALTTIPGIGRKLAERLVVELRDRLPRLESGPSLLPPGTADQTRIRSEALLALTSLGYTRAAAEKALRAALQETNGVSVEELIKAALRQTAKAQ